jgi:hypothetical protein
MVKQKWGKNPPFIFISFLYQGMATQTANVAIPTSVLVKCA